MSAGYGINRVVADLLSKGITRDVIEEIKDEFFHQKKEYVKQAIRALIEKKTHNQALAYEKKQKVIRYLLSRGFLIQEVLEVFHEAESK